MTDSEEPTTQEPEETTTRNTAEQGANVGIQAGQVHNSNVYMVMPDTPPRKKYEIGVRFLKDGVPARARELIDEAMAHHYEDGEVRFHWVLAMLSKRTYYDLDAGERDRLSRIPDCLVKYPDDEWKRALAAVHELLDCLYGSGGDTEHAHKKITDLPKYQREQVVRHLDLVLTGAAKDSLWAEACDGARAAQLSEDRVNRVWAYFQPDPVEARARKPALISTVMADWCGAFVGTMSFGIGACVGWTVMVNTLSMLAVACVVLVGAAGCVGLRDAWEWHYRVLRLRAEESAHSVPFGVEVVPDGLAGFVHRTFLYYSIKYAPKKRNLDRWLDQTAGIRATMRDEIVDLYKKTDIRSGRVRWLIRYLVKEVNKRQVNGTLWDFREQWRTRPTVRVRCVLSFAVFVPAAVYAVEVVARTDPVWGTLAAVLFLGGGALATPRWIKIITKLRWVADDRREYERVLADRQAERRRWVEKIESARPDESTMETWLNCDKTLLLNEGLDHYKLAWQDVIGSCVLQTPARWFRRARTSGLPWRYSKYDMRAFLITQDGVRVYNAEFDFMRAVSTRNERNNFRFDAVTSVDVIKTNELSYTLRLTLTNGPSTDILVTEATREADKDDSEAKREPDKDDESKKFSEINLEAAGFKPTLHILEGIGAEGKGWLQRDS